MQGLAAEVPLDHESEAVGGGFLVGATALGVRGESGSFAMRSPSVGTPKSCRSELKGCLRRELSLLLRKNVAVRASLEGDGDAKFPLRSPKRNPLPLRVPKQEAPRGGRSERNRERHQPGCDAVGISWIPHIPTRPESAWPESAGLKVPGTFGGRRPESAWHLPRAAPFRRHLSWHRPESARHLRPPWHLRPASLKVPGLKVPGTFARA